MSHPVCYTLRMKEIKNMKENNKANNLRLGAIYMNANTGTPCRLVHIIPCTGAWLETFDGEGYGDTVKFEDVFYADTDEVQDFLEDHRVYNDVTSTKVNNGIETTQDDSEYEMPFDDVIIERGFVQEDDVHYVGYYDDGHGNDIRCRD